jgi:hypothetical protein
MHKISTYLLLGSLAVIGACASTTQPDPDGQTHWMTRCDENADCGELSCICGVCTELCTANDECSSGESVATCQTAANVLDTTVCTTRQAAASVCVPLCDGQSDCNIVASDLMCLDNGVCAIDDLPLQEGDSSVSEIVDAGDRDATVDEEDPLPPDAGPITSIQAACNEQGDLEGIGPFEIVASGEVGGGLSIAPDGTVFAMGSLEDGSGGAYNNALRVVDGELEAYGVELWELQHMFVHGADVIVAKTNGSEVTIVQIDLATGEQLTLAIKEGINALAVTADDDAVYWITDVEQSPHRNQVWRSPRVPGESTLLGEFGGDIGWDGIVVVNDSVFYLGADTGDLELYEVVKDGSSSAITAIQIPETTSYMVSDGRDIFLAQATARDDLGNPMPGRQHAIMRLDPLTHLIEQVIDTGEAGQAALLLGGPYLYWTIDHMVEELTPTLTLWRAPKNGSGAPEELGTLSSYTSSLAEHDDALYWVSTCRVGNDGASQSHIVKRTD